MENSALGRGRREIFQTAVPNWTPVPILDPSHSKDALAEADQTAAFAASVSQRVQPARIYQSLPLPEVTALKGTAGQDSMGRGSCPAQELGLLELWTLISSGDHQFCL